MYTGYVTLGQYGNVVRFENINQIILQFIYSSQVLYVGDSYVPVTTQLRSRPISPADSTVLDWRLQTVESWDGRRHGNNKTRVQRTYIILIFKKTLFVFFFIKKILSNAMHSLIRSQKEIKGLFDTHSAKNCTALIQNVRSFFFMCLDEGLPT